MKMQKVKSSNVKGYKHNPETGVLTVTFHNGGRYAYQNVPIAKVAEMAAADSIGGYLASNIKPHHEVKNLKAKKEKR